MAATIEQQFEAFRVKGGLSALEPPKLGEALTTQQQERLRVCEKFQRNILHGFTVAELRDIGCF